MGEEAQMEKADSGLLSIQRSGQQGGREAEVVGPEAIGRGRGRGRWFNKGGCVRPKEDEEGGGFGTGRPTVSQTSAGSVVQRTTVSSGQVLPAPQSREDKDRGKIGKGTGMPTCQPSRQKDPRAVKASVCPARQKPQHHQGTHPSARHCFAC